MTRLLAVFLTLIAGVFAADRRNIAEIGQRMDHTAARAMWASAGVHADATGLDDQSFPQASGLITIFSNSGSGAQISFYAESVKAGSCFMGEVIAPNNSMLTTDTTCVPDASGGNYIQIWNGNFPGMWPSGVTRFRVLVNTNGTVSEANAYLAIGMCCVTSGPQINSVVPSADGSHLVVTGSFSTMALAAVNGLPVQTSVVPAPPTLTPSAATTTTITVNQPMGLNDGNGVLTICDSGQCSQTFFHIPSPPTSGGKG